MKWLKKEELVKGASYVVESRSFYLNVAKWTGEWFVGLASSCGFVSEDVEYHWDDGGTVKPLVMLREKEEVMDRWKHRSKGMVCKTCMFYVPKIKLSGKVGKLGRCHKNAPTYKGFVPIFEDEFCGDHRLDEEKIDDEEAASAMPFNQIMPCYGEERGSSSATGKVEGVEIR